MRGVGEHAPTCFGLDDTAVCGTHAGAKMNADATMIVVWWVYFCICLVVECWFLPDIYF